METCLAVIKVLKEFIKIPKTEEEWISVSEAFGKKWNFPNCIGAIDGKHVEIRKPERSGSFYFNYKKTFSIVLLAVVNANYEFITVEAGANGRISDEMPYVLVADDAFAMTRNLMKPYKGKGLSEEQIIFNYRLSRARRIVENAFGIVSSRFRVLLNKINLSPEKATILTLAACYLHNYLRSKNPSVYLRESVDYENTSNGEIQLGSWRADPKQLTELESIRSRNSSSIAKETRDSFCTYFNGVGAVPWQYMSRKNTNN